MFLPQLKRFRVRARQATDKVAAKKICSQRQREIDNMKKDFDEWHNKQLLYSQPVKLIKFAWHFFTLAFEHMSSTYVIESDEFQIEINSWRANCQVRAGQILRECRLLVKSLFCKCHFLKIYSNNFGTGCRRARANLMTHAEPLSMHKIQVRWIIQRLSYCWEFPWLFGFSTDDLWHLAANKTQEELQAQREVIKGANKKVSS